MGSWLPSSLSRELFDPSSPRYCCPSLSPSILYFEPERGISGESALEACRGLAEEEDGTAMADYPALRFNRNNLGKTDGGNLSLSDSFYVFKKLYIQLISIVNRFRFPSTIISPEHLSPSSHFLAR